MSWRTAIVVLLTVAACRDRGRGISPRDGIDASIARALTARFGLPVTVTCDVACRAVFVDGTTLPIELHRDGSWRVPGKVIDGSAIAAYVDATLADLGVAQTARCGPRIQRVAVGDRIACKLSAGGMAFAQIGEHTASLELALDAAAATARGEVVTPARAEELAKISRALEKLEGDSDGEDEVNARDASP